MAKEKKNPVDKNWIQVSKSVSYGLETLESLYVYTSIEGISEWIVDIESQIYLYQKKISKIRKRGRLK